MGDGTRRKRSSLNNFCAITFLPTNFRYFRGEKLLRSFNIDADTQCVDKLMNETQSYM